MVNVAQIATAVAVERTLVVGRPTVRGKFLYVGKEKFWVRGVSYGTFFVDDDGEERLNPEMVERFQRRPGPHGSSALAFGHGPGERAPGHGRPQLGRAHGLPGRTGQGRGNHRPSSEV